MKNTTTSAYPTSSTSTYETGLTTVYSGSPTITSTGIITLTLSNAFSYEAGKNIIVDICTSNTQENDNATCYYKTSGFNSCIYSRHSSTAQCAITTTTFSVVQQLPYLDFTYTAAACSALTSGGTISGNQSICSGGDPAVFASTVLPSGGSGGTITYQWQSATTNTEASFSDISGATSATYDPPTGLPSTTYYRRKAKRCTGGMEVTSGIVTVTVVPDPNAPSATKSPNTATACVGSTLTLSSPAYGSIPGMSCGFEYATTTNGTTWTAYSDAVPSLVAVAGTNGIRIRVKGGCISGCEASSFTEYTWTVSAVPTQPSVITGASPICSGVNQTFSVTNESGVTYAWTYSGTGTISGSGNSITLNATTGGTLTVTPSNGCGNGTARTLTISMTPILSAGSHNSDPLSGCIGTNVSLLSLSGVSGGKSPYSYQWQINGVNAPASANSANATSSTYDPDAFTSSGIYSIRCKVTDACGVIAYTAPKVVNVVADPTLPSATQSPTSSPVCSGTTLTLINPQYGVEQGMSCEFEYQASFDGGTTWSSVSTVIPVLSAGGSEVRIRMRVSSNCLTGCNASPWQTYTWSVIQPSIAPTNILGTTTLCNGNSTTLTLSGGTAGTGATAQWFAGSCGSTVIGTGSSISVSPSSNTTYFVRYSGTCNTTTCASISVNVSSVTPTSSLILGDMVWKGSSSVDYTDAANWLSFDGSQLVPSSSQPSTSTNVIIPVLTPACMAFQPNLDMKIGNARNFTIETGGVIDMGNGRLNVNGDFRNYGTFNEGASTVNMIGSADRDTIYGVGASHTFYNLTIDKVGGIEAVLASHIDVTNELRVVSKNLRLNSLNINLGTAGMLLDEGPGHRVYCDCATGYIQRIASIPAGVTVDPGNLGLTITTASGKPMGLTTIKRRHMRAGSQTGVNELKPGKPGVYRIFDVSPEFNGGTTYPLASGGLDVDLEYQYYIDEVGSDIAPLEDQFMVWRSGDAGSTWQSFGGTTNTATKTITLTGWPQFSWLTGGPPPSALPIELVSFEANCKGTNQVSITWSTATEHNTSHFVLDKSRDGVTWDLLGQVQAAGNSSQLTNYEMIDSEQLSGVTYYRLKQVDMNGEVETFYPVSASCKGGAQGNVLTTHPNPSTDGFYVNLFTETMEGNGQLTILDASGRRVYEKAISIKNGNSIFHIGDFDVEPGMYYIQVSNGTSSEIVKHILR